MFFINSYINTEIVPFLSSYDSYSFMPIFSKLDLVTIESDKV